MMKKVYSIVLCLCLVLTMLPVTAFAEDPGKYSNYQDGFYWCWPMEDGTTGNWVSDPNESLRTDPIPGSPGTLTAELVYIQNGQSITIDPDKIDVYGTYFDIREVQAGFYEIEIPLGAFGKDGYITYDGDSFHQLPVYSVIPEVWFYGKTTATEDNYLSVYDGSTNPIYLIPDTGWKLTSVRSTGDGCSIDISFDPANDTYATITVLDTNDSFIEIEYDGERPSGTPFEKRHLTLDIRVPGLYWRWPGNEDWSGDEPVFMPDPDGYLNHAISGTPYGAQYGQFVYLDANGNKEVVNCRKLTPTGDFYEMNDMGNDFTRIRTFDFGQGKISYNNKDIEIQSVLPMVGFYTDSTVSQSTFVPKWEYNGTNKTIYLVPENGVTLSNVSLRQQESCDVTVSFNSGDPYATVTMNQIDGNGYLEVSYDWIDTSRTRHEELGIGVVDKTPGLFWSYPKRDWPEEYVLTPEIDELQRGPIYGHPYGTHDRQFFFRDDNGNLTTLHCSDLLMSGKCFEMEDFQDDFIRMRFPEFGEGTVSYQGYSIRIITDLPDVGLYKKAAATKENCLIGHLDYNGDNNTIYLIARDGKTLSDVENMNSNQMTITLNSDKTCATIELQDIIRSGEYALELRFNVTNRDGLTYRDSIDFTIYDIRPGLYWRWPEWVNGEWVSDPNATLNRDAYNDINIYATREFLFRDAAGNLTRLSASDLTASDSFIDISDDSGMVLVGCTEFGTGTISYGDYSINITSQIPYLGLYSKAQRSEEYYLPKWDPAEMDTVYLYKADDNAVITAVSEETENGATFEIMDGGKYVAVHLQNNTSDFLKIKTVFHFTFDANDCEEHLGIDLVLPQNTEPEPTPSGGGGGGNTPAPEDPATTPEEPTEPVADPLQEEVPVEVTDPETGETETVTVTKAAAEAAEKFDDVEPTDYFAEAVGYAVEKGITAGVSENEFGPDQDCTRAQVVTMLWAANGAPEAEGETGFTDVKDNAYYEEAVAWAVEQDITNGTGDSEFSPDDTVTRAQFIMMLWISQGKPEVESGVPFEDVPADAYYAKAVAWAYANGITAGKSATSFGSDDPCTRGQIVTFLHVALDK